MKNIPLVGFYHISLVNHWEDIFRETLDTMIESGLYDALETIYVGVVDTPKISPWTITDATYDEQSYNKFTDIIASYNKFNILYRKQEPSDERSTYNILHDMCVQWSAEYPLPGYKKENKKILYFHSKGVTHTKQALMDGWRHTMEEFVLRQWRVAVEKLNDYDTVGCLKVNSSKDEYFTGYNGYVGDKGDRMVYPLHYTGGYWWANSEYIGRKINYTSTMRYEPPVGRVGPEGWICAGSPEDRHFSLFDTVGRLPELGQVILPDKRLWKVIKENQYILNND